MYFLNDEIDNLLEGEEHKNENYQFDMKMFECVCADNLFERSNIENFENEIMFWRYDKEKFGWGKQNIKITPSLMSYLAISAFKYKKFIPWKMYSEAVLSRYSVCRSPNINDDNILIGRAYQTYVAFLREVDAAIRIQTIYPLSKIYKNIILDLQYGVDLIVELGGDIKYIAIKHEGPISYNYNTIRKDKKEELSPYDITTMTAHHNKKDLIELVDNQDVVNLFPNHD